MLASVNATAGGIFTVPLQTRGQSHSAVPSNRIKNGMGIGLGSLQATGGVLGGGTASSSGSGILSQFSMQARSASPLTAGVHTMHRSRPASSTGAIQSRQIGLIDRMRRVNMESSLLQANANPLRTQGGFGIKSMTSGLSLLG